MNSLVYYRLIALWVLTEAMLGGIIHGLKLPVSGLIVGSCAVLCICLIAWYVPVKGAILKATIIVGIFKMMLSPQAPPPAYIAVFFQGLMGELLFWNRRFFKLSCLLVAVLSLLESGLQRILMLTIVYGNDLWKVINDFVNGLTKQKTTTNYSLLIGVGYVALHFIAGIFVGWWASVLPRRVVEWSKDRDNVIVVEGQAAGFIRKPGRKKRRIRSGLLIIWITLLLLYIQSSFGIGRPLIPSHASLKILVRAVIIVLAWYFVVGPLLTRLLHYWLRRKKTGSQYEVQRVLQLLPATQQLVSQSWKRSADKRGWRRVSKLSRMVLVNALNSATQPLVFILTAPIQSGKTTSLIKWSENRTDVSGILTPVVEGKRMFMNATTGQLFDMEAKEGEISVLTVGRFAFSKTGFDEATQVIRDNMHNKGWLIIDEIGPLEIRGQGFADVLHELLAAAGDQQRILLVAREGMVEKLKETFHIVNPVVISTVSEIAALNEIATTI